MNVTTFEEIWKCFYNNCMVDKATLPQTEEGQYILINSGCMYYNTLIDETETKIKCNDLTELINIKLDDNRLILLANCMRYRFLENELISFEQVWQPFSSEVGQKNYKAQIDARNFRLETTKKEIGRLLDSIDNMHYLG